jgi:hypothetical protein
MKNNNYADDFGEFILEDIDHRREACSFEHGMVTELGELLYRYGKLHGCSVDPFRAGIVRTGRDRNHRWGCGEFDEYIEALVRSCVR